MTAPADLRPPGWYFALALGVVPVLWPLATLLLAAAFTAGPGGAWAAGAIAAACGVGVLVSLGRSRGFDQRWVAASVLASAVVTAGTTIALVVAFVMISCEGAGPCFS